MKFLKKSQINFRNVKDDSIAIQVDGEVTMDTTNVLLVPKGRGPFLADGSTVDPLGDSQRPLSPTNGHVRYNTSTNEFELYQNSAWRKVSYKEPTLITQQGPWNGDDIELYFGPLNSGNPDYPYPETTNPQNILVFVENVFQISTTNYTLVDNPVGVPSASFYSGAGSYPAGRYVKFDSAVPFGKPVTVIHGFDR